MSDLKLYYKPTCPFCLKVLGFMKLNSISIPLKNINKASEIREELVTLGGKPQVPCLVIDGQPLYESNDIISWFKEHKDEL